MPPAVHLLGPDNYHCPDHFPFERHHQRALLAWALGLILAIVLLGTLASRLREQAVVHAQESAFPRAAALVS